MAGLRFGLGIRAARVLRRHIRTLVRGAAINENSRHSEPCTHWETNVGKVQG